GDLSSARCTVHEQGVATYLAIVSDVRVRKKKILIAQRGPASALFGSAAHRHVFAENVAVTCNQFHALATKRVILRVAADHAEGMKNILLSEFRRTLHHRM